MEDSHRRSRIVETAELSKLPFEGAPMADKSPRQNMSKKSSKSLKEKRAEKRAKADAKSTPEILPPTKKR